MSWIRWKWAGKYWSIGKCPNSWLWNSGYRVSRSKYRLFGLPVLVYHK